MKPEMRLLLARLSYPEKLCRVAELIEFSRRFKAVKSISPSPKSSPGDYLETRDRLFAGETVESLFEQARKLQQGS